MNFLLAPLLLLLTANAANPSPSSYAIPGSNPPEGVAFQPGTNYFYTPSSTAGIIFRGSLTSPSLESFITDPQFPLGFGTKFLAPDRLVIAGGNSGTVFVYSTTTRALLHRFANGLASDKTLLNDCAVDEVSGDIYVTDTTAKALWRIPARAVGTGEVQKALERWLDMGPHVGWVSLINGVAIPLGGGVVVVGDLVGGLWSVSMASKSVTKVNLGLWILGFPDGLLYKAPYLFAVNGAHLDLIPGMLTNFISVVELRPPYTSGKVVGYIKSPLLDKPSTASFVNGGMEMLVANYQFADSSPNLPFTIVRIPVQW